MTVAAGLQPVRELPPVDRMRVGVVGSGTMGRGIAQVVAQAGLPVTLVDVEPSRASAAVEAIGADLAALADRGKLTAEQASSARAHLSAGAASDLDSADLVVEAVFEDLVVKQRVFRELEIICRPEAILATNTSALSVTAIAGACQHPERVIGLHFFNPVPKMALVEVVATPCVETSRVDAGVALCRMLGKTPILVQDTPGFVVNRVARPFYLEALDIVGSGEAAPANVDAAMRAVGFKMGPFELMDFIGIDVNFAVSCAVFDAFFGEPRFRPHPLQRQMVELGRLGRKTGRGFYTYRDGKRLEPDAPPPPARGELALTGMDPIASRILAMILNEAHHALGEGVASAGDLDIAMKLGTSYPHGPLAWTERLRAREVADVLDGHWSRQHRERYRVAPALRRLAGQR